MAFDKQSDLLPIEDNNDSPHPYEVFGLEAGESNLDVIKSAVTKTIDQIKSAKANTDPALWKKVAGLVQSARVTLADPEKKSKLDAQFGIVSMETLSEPTKPAGDPLASILPTADPLASVLPVNNPVAVPSADQSQTDQPQAQPPSLPPGMFQPEATAESPRIPSQTPFTSPGNNPPAQLAPPAQVAPLPRTKTARRKPTRARRRSILGPMLMGLSILSLMGIAGALGYFVVYGPGEIEIVSTGDEFKISTGASTSNSKQKTESSKQPDAAARRQSPDLVMQGPNRPKPDRQSGQNKDAEMNSNAPTRAASDVDPMESAEVFETPPPTVSQPEMPQPEISEPEASEPDDQISDAMVKKAKQKLNKVRKSIRNAKWGDMKVLAEKAVQMQMTADQKKEAEALLSVADLATHYRGGIERAVAELNAGEDFKVSDSFRVIIVSKTTNSLKVRYNTKSPEFTFDEFPFSLAHKLATFKISDGSTRQAAKAVYQTIAPKATDGHRAESLTLLRAIDEPIKGADRDVLIETLQSLYGN